jgi:hypothetical protein
VILVCIYVAGSTVQVFFKYYCVGINIDLFLRANLSLLASIFSLGYAFYLRAFGAFWEGKGASLSPFIGY